MNFGGRNVSDLAISYDINVAAQTGAAIFTLPIPAPLGRNGLGPTLVLSYSSQTGNSPFGTGWSLSGLPAIGIDARRQVPRWDSRDGYALGGDELVPWLENEAGEWRPRGFDNGEYAVTFYRSRFGDPAVRVERWLDKTTGRVHFRTRDGANVLTIYGARPGSAARIADPTDDDKAYVWLPELQLDPHGNAIWFEYSPETDDGVDHRLPREHRHPSLAQRYLKRIQYGNTSPLRLTPELIQGRQLEGTQWCFQLVLDYGDHSQPQHPEVNPNRPWPARADAFSNHRAGFEIRTYRLCKRFLAFHQFDELGDRPTLVGALALEHDEDPSGAAVREVTYTGYRSDGSSLTLPPLRLTYSPSATAAGFMPAPAETQENVPAGLTPRQYAFVDLFGDGLPGILMESERSLYYKANLGNGHFGSQIALPQRPAIRPGTFSYGDHNRDGNTDLTQMAGRLAGFFELDRHESQWQSFRPFPTLPHVEALGARVQWVDLNGDGLPDVITSTGDGLVWFPSKQEGFGDPIEIERPTGRGAVPLVAEDLALDFFFADMDGDGLVDLVRVQNGRVEYWPNLGNGIFGQGILMGGSPRFAPDDEFDAGRLRFIDLDGSGTTDLIYLGRGEVTCWINACGNQLVPGPRLRGLPYLDHVSTARILDFLGDGRPCLVWSSPLPGRDSPIQHLPLAPDIRPRLLVSVDNSLGQETRLTYSSSAMHYLRDLRSDSPWTSRLPTHVTVVDRLEVIDHISNTGSVLRYEYREGHFDGEEREFRGFGRVDVYDSETSEAPAGTPPSVTPALTRNWFHLGTSMWNAHRPAGTYSGDAALSRISLYEIDSDEPLTETQANDAFRALAGRTFRRETYTIDERGRRATHPLEVFQVGFRVRRAQPAFGRARDAWSATSAEDLVATYEQSAGDPRISHQLTIETDGFGHVVREADVAYARRDGRRRDVTAQGETRVLVHDHHLVNFDEPGRFELGIAVEGKDFELLGLDIPPGSIVTRDRLRESALTNALASPRPHNEEPAGLAARLSSWEQSYYWNDERTEALPLRSVGALTLVHHEETACFTSTFVNDVYGTRAGPDRLSRLGYSLRDGYYWKRDDVNHFSPPGEFSQLISSESRDGARTTFTYDHYALETIAVEDALGNRTTAAIDYHLLAPWRIADPNGAISEVRYDALGIVVAATKHGAVNGAPWGFDSLSDFVTRQPATITDLVGNPDHYLQGAASFTYYDIDAWRRERAPTAVVSLVREELKRDGSGGGSTSGRIQVQVSYLDAMGRTLQTKTLVEPGPAIVRDSGGSVVVDTTGQPVLAASEQRWQTSGHVIYDAKQRPARVYEPFFSTTWRFEGDEVLRRFGVSSLTVYDALGRVVAHHLPNGTFTRTTYSAWTTINEDVNDTVLESRYRELRERLPTDDPERQAFEHARAHARTTTTTFLDPNGRAVGTLTLGGTADDRRTELRLDVNGEPREVIDPRGLVTFRYQHDMEGRVLFTESMDAGNSWVLPDADDRPAFSWDALGVEVEYEYDRLDRLVSTHVRGNGLDHRVEERIYGESLPDAAARNMRGRLVTVRDQAGETSVELYDPGGDTLRTTQRLRVDLGEPDWRRPVPLGESFVAEVSHDALGRPRREVLPDGTIRATDFLRGGGVTQVRITTPDGRLADVPVVNGAEFDAHGQRTFVRLGNGIEINYGYDRQTARLVTQTTRLGSRRLQDIRYSYDPVGNLIRLDDLVHNPGPSSFIQGVTMPARRVYSYDAHYRLASATGRVHQALLEHDYIPTVGTLKGTRHLRLNNGAALEEFTQRYSYDTANNIRQIRHVGRSRSWTTEMWISASSNRSLPRLDPGGIALPDPESHFDARGNLTRMSHLRRVEWSWRNTLSRAVIIERPGATDDDEAYTYGADRMRVRKVATRVVNGRQLEVIEKVYLGATERKRVLRNGRVILERWTIRVSHDQGRVVLVHRWITDARARETDQPDRPRIVYQLTTHQNSSAIEIDQEGNLVSYEEYFPYGGTAFIAGDSTREVELKEYRYMGKERDDTTSLYYYGHRYYAPWMGRWLSPDPIGPDDDLNLYQFVLSNPINLVDADGLQTTHTNAQPRPQIQYIPFERLPEPLQTPEIRRSGHQWLPGPNPVGERHSITEIYERAIQSHALVFVYSPAWQRVYEATGDEQLATETANRFTGQFGNLEGAPTTFELDRAVGSASPTESTPESSEEGRATAASANPSRRDSSPTPSRPEGSGSRGSSHQQVTRRGRTDRGQGTDIGQNQSSGPSRNASHATAAGQAQGNGVAAGANGDQPPGTPSQVGDPVGANTGATNGVPTPSSGTELPPPNQITAGRNPQGSYSGSDRGHGTGTPYGTEAGTDQNHRPPSRGPALTGEHGGSPRGNAGAGWELLGSNHSSNPPNTNPLDYLYSLARVATQDFPEEDRSSRGGGMPGGRGRLRINRHIGQILHLLYQWAISIIFGGLLSIASRVVVGLVRGAIALTLLRRLARLSRANMAAPNSSLALVRRSGLANVLRVALARITRRSPVIVSPILRGDDARYYAVVELTVGWIRRSRTRWGFYRSSGENSAQPGRWFPFYETSSARTFKPPFATPNVNPAGRQRTIWNLPAEFEQASQMLEREALPSAATPSPVQAVNDMLDAFRAVSHPDGNVLRKVFVK